LIIGPLIDAVSRAELMKSGMRWATESKW